MKIVKALRKIFKEKPKQYVTRQQRWQSKMFQDALKYNSGIIGPFGKTARMSNIIRL